MGLRVSVGVLLVVGMLFLVIYLGIEEVIIAWFVEFLSFCWFILG